MSVSAASRTKGSRTFPHSDGHLLSSPARSDWSSRACKGDLRGVIFRKICFPEHPPPYLLFRGQVRNGDVHRMLGFRR